MKHSVDRSTGNKISVLEDILRSRIESGEYPAGCRLPSIRMLSSEFNLVIRTIQLALEHLEDEGYIVSIHGKGSYVNEHYIEDKCGSRIAFVFPEAAISDEILNPENWTTVQQFSSGLFAGAQKYGAEVIVLHVDRHLDEMQQLRWLRKLKKYDAVVFPDYQLASLQKELAQEIPVFTICTPQDSKAPFISYNRFMHRKAISKLVAHAVECGSKSVGVISLLEKPNGPIDPTIQFFKERAALFIQECEKHHLVTKESFCLSFNKMSEVRDSLTEVWKNEHPDFLFCNQAFLPKIVYQVCMEKKLRIGVDIRIAAYASGMTFHGLFPEMTYIKTSLFESGMNIVREVCRYTSNEVSIVGIDLPEVDFPLIVNASTSPNNKPRPDSGQKGKEV